MVKTVKLLSCVIAAVDATSACSGVTWVKGGTRQAATNANSNCGAHDTQTTWGDLLPWNSLGGTAGVTDDADGCAGAACIAGTDYANCCHAACSFSTWMGGTGTDVAANGATKATVYCGTGKVPKASLTTIGLAVQETTRNAPDSNDIGSCCDDACSTTTVTYNSGAGTASGTNYYCGTGRIPVANQATTPSGVASNAGAQQTTCCNDACGKVSFKAGEGTDNSGATTPEYYCGANKVPVDSQDSKDSGSDAVGAGEKNACCDDACGKVTFKAGDGTDDSSSTTYYCGENRVPVKDQASKPSGSDSVGAGSKSTCCDDACGKVTFKAGKGTDDSSNKVYYCGENKVPVAKQKDEPSGSDSIGSGQKSKCCAAACSTVSYKAGEGTDKDTTYFCGKNQAPKKDQKTLPCDGSSCSASGKKDCCAATCASTKWAMGKKPKSPASKTMYCGDGMSPKAALADTVCAGEECDEATDAAACCEKTKINNTTATTDARATGASVLLLFGVVAAHCQ